MSLSPIELSMLSKVKHTNTPLGIVAILNFSDPFPQGWERLSLNEGR